MLKRVEICGGIASGKTTLANIFLKRGYIGVLEDFKKNPFWSSFYQNPKEHAFETEITFLLQHYYDIKTVGKDGSQIVICDFSLVLDRAYADVNLQGARLRAFDAVYEVVSNELPGPALIANLECSGREELCRIRRRARHAGETNGGRLP